MRKLWRKFIEVWNHEDEPLSEWEKQSIWLQNNDPR